MKRQTLLLWSAMVIAPVFFLLGRMTNRPTDSGMDHSSHAQAEAKDALWTCPMHPQIKLPEFGDCPICGMDLVPLEAGGGADFPRRLAMSESDRRLAEIVTGPVERRFVTKEIRLVGKVDYDETRIRSVAARVPGQNRLDRLYVDYKGVSVKKGDHLVWLYSPELVTAQEELLESKKRLANTESESSTFLAESNRRSYDSARDKLILWGLTEEQVDAIELRGTAEDHMMITSPVSGIVIHKAVSEGDYVGVGSQIYQIADLGRLWIWLHAYEQDLSWIRYGQAVSVLTEAHPGEVFAGTIAFIDPTLDETTRTVKVRVNLGNLDGKLKPGMFVRAVVRSRVALGGKVMDPALAGKWISPMHPEIIKDGPGTCDVCGMDLVPAEQLDYVSPDDVDAKPLVVPASAVLITGKRAVVYVEVPGQERPTFEGREVALGQRAGDDYIVLEGLKENERVVVNGAFKLDSALQIQAKPSMMSMEAEAFYDKRNALFRSSLDPLYEAYLATQTALAADDVQRARQGYEEQRSALREVVAMDLDQSAKLVWDEERRVIENTLLSVPSSADMAQLRSAFLPLSNSMIALEKSFGHAGEAAHHETFCPMAFENKGGAWLQTGDTVRNPYYGSEMLACGVIRHTFPGLGGAHAESPHDPNETHEHPPEPPAEKDH